MARAVARGDVWTVAGGPDYAGKPRPAAIVQDDRFDTDSITVCPFTADPTDAPLFRPALEPTPANGLREPSRLMVEYGPLRAECEIVTQPFNCIW